MLFLNLCGNCMLIETKLSDLSRSWDRLRISYIRSDMVLTDILIFGVLYSFDPFRLLLSSAPNSLNSFWLFIWKFRRLLVYGLLLRLMVYGFKRLRLFCLLENTWISRLPKRLWNLKSRVIGVGYFLWVIALLRKLHFITNNWSTVLILRSLIILFLYLDIHVIFFVVALTLVQIWVLKICRFLQAGQHT